MDANGPMGKLHPQIDEALEKFITAQSIFFVASAPMDAKGRVNLSPKGLNTFRILGPKTVCYLYFTGSGVETIAHLKENGRIVLMFCAFQVPPNIVRLHGHGRVVEPDHPEFQDLQAKFPSYESMRSIIVVELDRITDSCGYGVPLLRYEGERPQLSAWARKKGPEGLSSSEKQTKHRRFAGARGIEIRGCSSENQEDRVARRVVTCDAVWQSSSSLFALSISWPLGRNPRRRSL